MSKHKAYRRVFGRQNDRILMNYNELCGRYHRPLKIRAAPP